MEAKRSVFLSYMQGCGLSPDTDLVAGSASHPDAAAAIPGSATVATPSAAPSMIGGHVKSGVLIPKGPVPVDMPDGDWAKRMKRFNAGFTCWCDDVPKCHPPKLLCSRCLLSSLNPEAEDIFAAWAKKQGWEVTRDQVKDTYKVPTLPTRPAVDFLSGGSSMDNPLIMPTLKRGDYIRFDNPIRFNREHYTHWARYLGQEDYDEYEHKMMAVAAFDPDGMFHDPQGALPEGCALAEQYIWKLMDNASLDNFADYRIGRQHIAQVVRLSNRGYVSMNAETIVTRLYCARDYSPLHFSVWTRPY